MPIDEEHEELDDGSAGGQIRWSPDNVIAPAPASAAANGAPVSWDTLFTAPAPAAAEPAQAASFAPAVPAQPLPAVVASSEPPPDPYFSKGPGQQSAAKPVNDDNPFTTPDQEQEQTVPSAPAFSAASLPSPEQRRAPAPTPAAAPTPAPAPAPAPAPTPAPTPAAPRPPAPTATPSQMQATPQALGFNPAPGFSSSSDSNPRSGSDSSSAPQVVKQYFTEEDIEVEIVKELEITGQMKSPYAQQAKQTPAETFQQTPEPSPIAQYLATQVQGQPSSVPNYASAGGPGATKPKPPAPAPELSVDGEEGGEDGPDLSAVPEIETARIWEQRSCKEILHGILKAKRAEYAVALLASTDGSVQGEMLIVKSVVIHGAKLVEPDLSGYEALKVMLAIPHGTYTLLDVTEYVDSAQQLEQGLSIRITPLANALPNLPDSVDELMGASQISRIRSKGPADLEAEEVKVKPPKQQTTLRERLPSTKMMVLIGLTVLALIMMVVVLYMHR